MAKRFTDTEKWKKEFIKGLNPKMKLLWFYILDDCDHSGMWQVDMEVASLRIGEPITYEEAFTALGSQIQVYGKFKWFIEDFVSFQYGQLRPSNRMHQAVITTLTKHKIPVLNGHIRALEGVKEKDKEKEKEKDKEEDQVPRETEPEQVGPKPPEDDMIEPLTDAWFAYIFDELEIERKKVAYRDHDVPDQLEKFKSKVRGSPGDYIYRDTAGVRSAFDYHLRNTKPQKKYAPSSRTLTETSPTPGKDYSEKF